MIFSKFLLVLKSLKLTFPDFSRFHIFTKAQNFMRYKKLWDTVRSLFLYFRSPYLSIHLLCILNHLRPYCPLSGQVHNRLQGTSAGKTLSSSFSLIAQVATYGTMNRLNFEFYGTPLFLGVLAIFIRQVIFASRTLTTRAL